MEGKKDMKEKIGKSKEVKTIIKYDGSKLKDHTIDIKHLAPSLLAISELIILSNEIVNGNKAQAKALIRAGIEQNCFQLELSVIQNVIQIFQPNILEKDILTIKEICEMIGVIGYSSIDSNCSLFELITFLKGKVAEKINIVKLETGKIIIRIGKETKIINKYTYNFYCNKDCLKEAVNVFSPIHNKACESIEFNDKKTSKKFTKKKTPKNIEDLPKLTEEKTSITRETLRIKKPDYEGNSQWELSNDTVGKIKASITDKTWLKRFQKNSENAPPTSYLDVDLKTTYLKDINDKKTNDVTYEITKVYKVTFLKPEIDPNLFDN